MVVINKSLTGGIAGRLRVYVRVKEEEVRRMRKELMRERIWDGIG